MAIDVTCRKCGKAYSVREERAGTKIRCKECQGTIAVPSIVADDEYSNDYGGDAAWGGDGKTRGQQSRHGGPARSRTRTTSKVAAASAFTVRKLFGVLALVLAAVMCVGIVVQIASGNVRALGAFVAVAAVGGVGIKWLRT